MTHDQHDEQRRRVHDAELAAHHPDVYRRHPLRQVVDVGEASMGACAQSIRELGEMMQAAERHPDHRTRLDELERLAGRVGWQVRTLRRLLLAEYANAMGAIGVPPAGHGDDAA